MAPTLIPRARRAAIAAPSSIPSIQTHLRQGRRDRPGQEAAPGPDLAERGLGRPGPAQAHLGLGEVGVAHDTLAPAAAAVDLGPGHAGAEERSHRVLAKKLRQDLTSLNEASAAPAPRKRTILDRDYAGIRHHLGLGEVGVAHDTLAPAAAAVDLGPGHAGAEEHHRGRGR
jgi:hypothetical protein